MNLDKAKQLADNALESLVEAVQQGGSGAITAYLQTITKFHRYSFGNQRLIACQRPNATRVAGFNTWKSLGRFVRKGEKGITILAPMKFTRAVEDDDERSAAEYVRFRTVAVFDVAQTDGEPLPELGTTTGDPGTHLAALKGFIASRGIALEYTDTIRPALGTSSGGRMRIAVHLEPAEEFSVLAHELAHELLHHGSDRPASRTVCETEAEATAYTVCKHIGLDTSTAAHDYIALYDGDRGALVQSLTIIRDAAALIITALGNSAEETTGAAP